MCGLLTAACPRVCAKIHDWFEISHRFFGWTILALFWVQTWTLCIFTSSSQAGKAVIRIPAFWALLVMTAAVMYPWLRVRRVKVRCEMLSSHAIRMHIDDKQSKVMQPCRVIAISHSPLKETHKFATIPEPDGGRDTQWSYLALVTEQRKLSTILQRKFGSKVRQLGVCCE
jgi:hypothetical protein